MFQISSDFTFKHLSEFVDTLALEVLDNTKTFRLQADELNNLFFILQHNTEKLMHIHNGIILAQYFQFHIEKTLKQVELALLSCENLLTPLETVHFMPYGFDHYRIHTYLLVEDINLVISNFNIAREQLYHHFDSENNQSEDNFCQFVRVLGTQLHLLEDIEMKIKQIEDKIQWNEQYLLAVKRKSIQINYSN